MRAPKAADYETDQVISTRLNDQVDSAMRKRNWAEAAKLSTGALKKLDRDYWFRHCFYSNRAFAYYAQNKITRALRDSTMAAKLMPRCPYTIEIHTMIVHEYGRQKNHTPSFREAVKYGNRIVNRSIESMMKDKCTPASVRVADRIINDTYYILGFAYWNLGKLEQARTCFGTYIEGRNSGTKSIWNLRNAKAELRELEAEISAHALTPGR